jgi:multidrug efflux pump
MGVAVFAGMLGVTLFGLALTPVFYWTIRRLTGGKPKAAQAIAPETTPAPELPHHVPVSTAAE